MERVCSSAQGKSDRQHLYYSPLQYWLHLTAIPFCLVEGTAGDFNTETARLWANQVIRIINCQKIKKTEDNNDHVFGESKPAQPSEGPLSNLPAGRKVHHVIKQIMFLTNHSSTSSKTFGAKGHSRQ